MIRNYICFRDYETGSKNKFKTQPIQIAAVMINLPRLEVVEDSLFESLIQPEWDESKCEELGIDPIQDEALAINKITREELKDAPQEKVVWQKYCDYLKDYNLKGIDGGKWDAPIIGGFNNRNFDDMIDIRLCEKYGPNLDDFGGWTMYHPFYNFDVAPILHTYFHNKKIVKNNSYSMDACREFFGYKTENAHKADIDVLQGADMLVRFLKLSRKLVAGELNLPEGKKIKFKNVVGGKL